MMKTLSSIIFSNDFVQAFPGDESGDRMPRQTPGKLWSKALPTAVANPQLLAWSEDLAAQLGIQRPGKKDLAILGGNDVTGSMFPYAACYAGHQFGNWAGQLGDGRAITLAEHTAPDGKKWELQLKGAGPTAYSRRADGRAVLRSSVREYLMSEAMHYLRVPTTRALSLVSTGDQVLRDMFYDGNAAYEPGAIVMRVAPSFLRFGNFEMLAAREEKANLQKLVDWTIDRYYPQTEGEGNQRILNWLREIVDRTAFLMAEWLRVGFVHGVMNTDNMSILGLTIDYGPYSFVDDFDPNFTPNTTDLPGRRYAFGRQPSVAYWNLGCLAGALAPLFPDTKGLVEVLEEFKDRYLNYYYLMMANKLGLDQPRPGDSELFASFEKNMQALKADMTIFYQLLTELPAAIPANNEVLNYFEPCFYQQPGDQEKENLFLLIQAYQQRLKQNSCSDGERLQKMRRANPRFILRNYLLHQSIEALEKGDDSLFRKLEQAMKDPYSNDWDEFFLKRPAWAAQKAGSSMLSCSS